MRAFSPTPPQTQQLVTLLLPACTSRLSGYRHPHWSRPLDLIARLAALVPMPLVKRRRLDGMLALSGSQGRQLTPTERDNETSDDATECSERASTRRSVRDEE